MHKKETIAAHTLLLPPVCVRADSQAAHSPTPQNPHALPLSFPQSAAILGCLLADITLHVAYPKPSRSVAASASYRRSLPSTSSAASSRGKFDDEATATTGGGRREGSDKGTGDGDGDGSGGNIVDDERMTTTSRGDGAVRRGQQQQPQHFGGLDIVDPALLAGGEEVGYVHSRLCAAAAASAAAAAFALTRHTVSKAPLHHQ